MKAVSYELAQTILKLQNLSSISKFSLGGGTNLALRYAHRISIDIDFISSNIIGREGFERIISDVKAYYGDCLMRSILINQDLGEQYMFLRMFINTGNETIKIEFLQNMKCLFAPEIVDGFRLINENDIGIFKLISSSNRFAKKDIYDLDFITDNIPLSFLYKQLSEKKKKFNLPEHQSLFDLDTDKNLLDDPELLLKFDESRESELHRPMHTHDRIDIVESSKSWNEARLSWRMKVRKLFTNLGKEFPKSQGKHI
ncbi:nucleotidyl transferase AbiEii/AbiGii toxin family protein [Elizabethkingia anophelis]|uniref:nucleotidyl transferase AbiEii/AbiGii toxin family protein n=1 Tax=Elizabethkingia anophelis TaxID=1117645 RepID=UPI0038925EFA